MGLIMLILVGTVPTAYALNRAMPAQETAHFVQVASAAQKSLAASTTLPAPADSRAEIERFLREKRYAPEVVPALAAVTAGITAQVRDHGTLAKVPATAVVNVRNDLYLVGEGLRLLEKQPATGLTPGARLDIEAFDHQINDATRFIPVWVKVAVAIALGLGTMVGWKRIVVTVGEKIGKTHLSYGQGASAEIVAMLTIGAADAYGLPVSTTHVLSSGVAGTMAANGSGLQMRTLRNIGLAWVLTLPAAMLLSGSLYWLFTRVF